MVILTAGALYFGIVFAVGFVLGVVRTLLLVPKFGARNAELMELPLMVATSFFAARWVVRHLSLNPETTTRIAVGLFALTYSLNSRYCIGCGGSRWASTSPTVTR
jgi:hypothetical protein